MGRTGGGHRREHYRRAPTDFSATGVLLRTATCISGQVEVMVDCAPLSGYGTVEGTWRYQDEVYERMTVAPKEGDLRLAVVGSIRLGTLGVRLYGRTTLTEGESAYVALSWGAGSVPASWEEATAAVKATIG